MYHKQSIFDQEIPGQNFQPTEIDLTTKEKKGNSLILKFIIVGTIAIATMTIWYFYKQSDSIKKDEKD